MRATYVAPRLTALSHAMLYRLCQRVPSAHILLRVALLTAAMMPIAMTTATAQRVPLLRLTQSSPAQPFPPEAPRTALTPDTSSVVPSTFTRFQTPSRLALLEGIYEHFGRRTSSAAVTSMTASELAINVDAVLWIPLNTPGLSVHRLWSDICPSARVDSRCWRRHLRIDDESLPRNQCGRRHRYRCWRTRRAH